MLVHSYGSTCTSSAAYSPNRTIYFISRDAVAITLFFVLLFLSSSATIHCSCLSKNSLKSMVQVYHLVLMRLYNLLKESYEY